LAGYMHGNLALDDRNERTIKTRETKQAAVRKQMIPAQEKLLYLFTIMICVVVAGVIIFRYAQIYEVNTRVQQIEAKIEQLENENRTLKLSVRKLQEPKRLIEMGEALGFVPSAEEKITQVVSNPNPLPNTDHDIALLR
jgi:cell division protein FtsL